MSVHGPAGDPWPPVRASATDGMLLMAKIGRELRQHQKRRPPARVPAFYVILARVMGQHDGELEAHAYGADSTPEEVAALRRQVSLLEPGIVLYREAPVMSEFQIDVYMDRLTELIREHGQIVMIIDLAAGGRADAPARARIKARISDLRGKFRHVAVVGDNRLGLISARLIGVALGVEMSTHRRLAEAREAARRARG